MLMIDIGNSRIKCALWLDNAWQLLRSQPYQQENLNNQFDLLFEDIVPQPVYVTCVVDALKDALALWFLARWALQPVFAVSTKQLCGVTNAYEQPESLGVDRWLAVVAAYTKLQSPVCVIDCGTAVTVDVVDANGMHMGGLIMPGLRLMRESLFGNASKIDSVKGNLVELAINTKDAVESGCVHLLSSGLDQICRIQQEKQASLRIVITGGDGELIARQMHLQTTYIEMLVLDGLCIAATKDG